MRGAGKRVSEEFVYYIIATLCVCGKTCPSHKFAGEYRRQAVIMAVFRVDGDATGFA